MLYDVYGRLVRKIEEVEQREYQDKTIPKSSFKTPDLSAKDIETVS